MNINIYNLAIQQALKNVQATFEKNNTKNVLVNGQPKSIPYPFPSPTDWRDNWIYFLMIDRFNNPIAAPACTTNPNGASAWNERYNFRQGGNFNGIKAQLDYIASLGAGAIWITPVLKNAKPIWVYEYHGYAAQDFLSIDGRFGSDGTEATAEQELIELIDAAHARGLYVIIDIVINHSARVFDYLYNSNSTTTVEFTDPNVMNGPLGSEPPIQWLNGFGFPRSDWQNTLAPANILSPDDAVWPQDLQRTDFFRRRGNRLSDDFPPNIDFVHGDFDDMRQMVMEYDAQAPNQKPLRDIYGINPVLNIIITAYQYMIAKFDIDAFRIDTVKYVQPQMVETFGNAIREYALSIGKKNFFTFGEIYGSDENILEKFVGRSSSDIGDGFGIDAALDYPLFGLLPNVAKCLTDVSLIQQMFQNRKNAEDGILSSHGEAGKYFVTFLDNHDQYQRFNCPTTFQLQVLAGLAILFCLQGIPCVYYGTEQGLQGTVDATGKPDLNSFESTREALWGKDQAFDQGNNYYQDIKKLGTLRNTQPALLYGRLYFRQVSGTGKDFGFSTGKGGVLAFSRVLCGVEILIVFNSNTTIPFYGFVAMDVDINRSTPTMNVSYSNMQTIGKGQVQIDQVTFYGDALNPYGNQTTTGETAKLYVVLAPMEVQILVPV
jgi:glycosidase